MRDDGTLEDRLETGRPLKQSEETKTMMIEAVEEDLNSMLVLSSEMRI